MATGLSGHQAWPMAGALGADGAPPCHSGERILASGSVQLPRFTLLESGSLLVSPAHLADAGTYTCLATNSRGVDEASADLVVWGKAPTSAARLCLPPCLCARCRMDPAWLHGQPDTASYHVWCGMELSGVAKDGHWHVAGWFGWVQTWAVPANATPRNPLGSAGGLSCPPAARTRISDPPQDQSVIKGTKAVMSCGVTHDPSVDVRYVRQGWEGWGDPGTPRPAACLPAWGGSRQMVGASIPSPALVVLQCHLVPCAQGARHAGGTPGPLSLWGAAGYQDSWVPPAQVHLGEGRGTAEPRERPTGAPG